MQKKHIFLIISIVVLSFLVISILIGSNRLYSREVFINIDSGRIKTDDYALYILYNSNIRDTEVSRLINRPDNSKYWRIDSNISPWTITSPNYNFHGAILDLQRLASILEMKEVENENCLNIQDKKGIIEIFLKLWKDNENRSSGSKYILSLDSMKCNFKK